VCSRHALLLKFNVIFRCHISQIFVRAYSESSIFLCILCIAIGMAMSMSAFSLALNSYFNKRRDRAVALTMTIVGIGPILVPQIASLALSSYGIQVLQKITWRRDSIF